METITRHVPTADQIRAFRDSARDAEASTRCLLATFALLGIPRSLIDVGCGPGHLVRCAARLGVRAAGFDIALTDGAAHLGTAAQLFGAPTAPGCTVLPEGILAQVDLEYPFRWEAPAEMVLCWEVAEHLRPEASETLCAALARVAAPDGLLVFSAATPGQGGSGHLNERDPGFWRELLETAGFDHVPERSQLLRPMLKAVAPTAWWYGKNVAVYRRAR